MSAAQRHSAIVSIVRGALAAASDLQQGIDPAYRRAVYVNCASGFGNKLRVLPTAVVASLASKRVLSLTASYGPLWKNFALPSGVSVAAAVRVGGRNDVRWSTVTKTAVSGPLACVVGTKRRTARQVEEACLHGALAPGAPSYFGINSNQELDMLFTCRGQTNVWRNAMAALNAVPRLADIVWPPSRAELSAAVVGVGVAV